MKKTVKNTLMLIGLIIIILDLLISSIFIERGSFFHAYHVVFGFYFANFWFYILPILSIMLVFTEKIYLKIIGHTISLFLSFCVFNIIRADHYGFYVFRYFSYYIDIILYSVGTILFFISTVMFIVETIMTYFKNNK